MGKKLYRQIKISLVIDMFRENNQDGLFIIAEIGINHNGSIDLTKKLIDAAVDCGCDAVKFQTRTLETVIPRDMWHIKKETPWGIIDYIDYKKRIELKHEDYHKIDAYCKEKNIKWFSSAWDLDSQLFLRDFDLEYNKIASPMLSYIPLLEEVANERKMTFISTGGHTLKDIDLAVNLFEEKKTPYVIMHCINIYPCPDDKLNLGLNAELINFDKKLRDEFPSLQKNYDDYLTIRELCL